MTEMVASTVRSGTTRTVGEPDPPRFGYPAGAARRYTSGQTPDPLSTGKATRVHRANPTSRMVPLGR